MKNTDQILLNVLDTAVNPQQKAFFNNKQKLGDKSKTIYNNINVFLFFFSLLFIFH